MTRSGSGAMKLLLKIMKKGVLWKELKKPVILRVDSMSVSIVLSSLIPWISMVQNTEAHVPLLRTFLMLKRLKYVAIRVLIIIAQ